MNFKEIAETRQSCRSYNSERIVENQKLYAILKSARLAPSTCNGQPYHITICKGEVAKKIATSIQSMGRNKFVSEVPVLMVISEKPYSQKAALGAVVKKSDYRSIDIGILSAYITAEATAQGLGTCIIGWFDNRKIRKILTLDGNVRLVIALGYAKDDDKLRTKKRKDITELVSFAE